MTHLETAFAHCICTFWMWAFFVFMTSLVAVETDIGRRTVLSDISFLLVCFILDRGFNFNFVNEIFLVCPIVECINIAHILLKTKNILRREFIGLMLNAHLVDDNN